jgi:RNA polymerase sigma-70 factor (ECF subfamily)
MSDANTFLDLIRRVRARDERAADELVQRYESHIRRAVRMQLRDARLRRVLDSMDICQSVLANFFVRAGLGQFDLATPQQLVKLLATMARNKLAAQARRSQVVRREYPDLETQRGRGTEPAAAEASPSRLAAGRELLARVRQQLSAEERLLAEQRAAGRSWADIAAEQGTSAEALRKKLSRALDRVAEQLGLEELDHA